MSSQEVDNGKKKFKFDYSIVIIVLSCLMVFITPGFSFTTTTMVDAVINRWCKKNKGTIMGLALETIMLPIYARELFGERRFNEALGIFASVNTAGYAVGEPLSQLCYDLFGNYNVCIYVSVGMMLVALVVVHIVISISKKQKHFI